VNPANDPSALPLYLIVAGVLLLIGWGVLLYRVRRSKAEEEAPSDRESGKASLTKVSDETVPSEAAPQEKTEVEPAAVELSEEGTVRPIGELCEPFVETPDVTRDSFVEFATRRILLVEDNPVNRKLVETLLAGSGIDLESAVDGVEALEMLREAKHPFELVLMDVNMPRMDGLECTRQIRKDPELSGVCVLALTASTTPEEVEAIVESGMDGFLEKPIVLGQLYTAFTQCLTRERKEHAKHSSKESEILDERVGLQFTNGDRELYRTILEDFMERYSHADEEFSRLVEEKDLQGLRTLIVDLEGLSGTMGAKEFYDEVRKINALLDQAPVAMLKEYEEPFAEAFKRLTREIDARLESL